MNEKQSLILSIAGEQSHELNRLLSYWLLLPKIALHLHNLKDSGHAQSGR